MNKKRVKISTNRVLYCAFITIQLNAFKLTIYLCKRNPVNTKKNVHLTRQNLLIFSHFTYLLCCFMVLLKNRFNLNSVGFYMPSWHTHSRINTAACHSLAGRHYFIQYDSLTYPYTKTHTLINRIIAQNTFAMLLG